MEPLFQNRANRDKAWREAGKPGSRITHRNQYLHPQYVEDYDRKLSAEECGFGNTIYKTFFARLYTWQS